MSNKLANLLNKNKVQSSEPKEQPEQQEAESKHEAAEAPAADAPKKPAVKGLGGLKLAKPPVTASSTSHGKAPESKEVMTLDDLENSTDLGSSRASTVSGFGDEIDATKPLRDLEAVTEGMDEESATRARQFAMLADGVYSILDDAEMLGNVIRSIMIELKANPQYINKDNLKKSIVQPGDVLTWIRAMRENMGLQRIKKEASKRTGSKKSSAAADMDMLSDLENMDLGDF